MGEYIANKDVVPPGAFYHAARDYILVRYVLTRDHAYFNALADFTPGTDLFYLDDSVSDSSTGDAAESRMSAVAHCAF